MIPYSFLKPPERTDKEVAAQRKAERLERERLAWLGFYNTASIACVLMAASGGEHRTGDIMGIVEGMMKNYRKTWESDEELG